MNQNSSIDHDSPAVQKHIEIMQSVITRMAENSRACKVWCVTLVSAVLVLVARTGSAEHTLIALLPTALFYMLDAYYLALERGFRQSYGRFVNGLHDGQATTSDLYAIVPGGSIVRGVIWAMFKSFSVLPFYLVVVVTVILSWQLIF